MIGPSPHHAWHGWVVHFQRPQQVWTSTVPQHLPVVPSFTASVISRDVVSEILLEELWSKTGLNKQPSIYLNSHLWRYAIAARELNVECLNATSSNLVICGDWAHGSRIEGAFLSGLSASNKMLQKL